MRKAKSVLGVILIKKVIKLKELNMIQIQKRARARPKNPVFYAVLKLLLKLLTILLVIALIFTFIFGAFRIKDATMVPNVNPGDLILYYRLDRKFLVTEVVVFNYKGKNHLARIVAQSGDTVDINENGLVVNGSVQSESKIYKETLAFKEGVKFPLKLKENEYFLLSDNRDKGFDSRIFGAVEKKKIQGKIFTLLRRRGI